jgi:enamine deaminase RidA (YjgF/YER057c/UK114 family)
MKTKIINPWKWQDALGFAQAVEVKHFESVLYCSGQTAMSAEGQPVDSSMADQITLSLQNLETVIAQAGYAAANISRLNIYTTSIADFFAAYGNYVQWLRKHQLTPSSTLVEVRALAFPELKVELEATVVK